MLPIIWGFLGCTGDPHLVLEGVQALGGELGLQVLAGDEGQQLVGQGHRAQPVAQAQLHHCGENSGGPKSHPDPPSKPLGTPQSPPQCFVCPKT